MRDILPIAHFECLQKVNWEAGRPVLDAFDFCESVYPIRQAARDIPIEELLKRDRVLDLCASFADRLDGCVSPIFRNPSGWQSFLDEWTAESSIDRVPFSESGPYILSTLFHQHLPTLGLLTAWTVIDVLGQHVEQPPLRISQNGLGRLVEDISFGGPPIFDVEEMRREFSDRYSQ